MVYDPSPKNDTGSGSIIIVESQHLLADTIRRILAESMPTLETVCITSAARALEELRRRTFRLAVVGLNLPDTDGLDLLQEIVADRLALRILVVSSRRDDTTRIFLRQIGIHGWFDPRQADADTFLGAIQAAWKGEPAPSLIQDGFDPKKHKARFSPTEHLVLALIGAGHGEQRAADHLGISHHTLRTHVKHLKMKLGVHTLQEMVREAVKHGIVRITEDRILFPGIERTLAQRMSRNTSINFSQGVSPYGNRAIALPHLREELSPNRIS